MISRIDFRGRYQFRCAADLTQTVLEVSARRLLKGPRLPGWNWFVEIVTRGCWKSRWTLRSSSPILKKHQQYLDTVVVRHRKSPPVNIRQVAHEQFKGKWFSCKDAKPSLTLLYFHGGGYSFYPQAYATFVAQLTVATKAPNICPRLSTHA